MRTRSSIALLLLAVMMAASLLWLREVWATPSQGHTGGTRGTRSYASSAPRSAPGYSGSSSGSEWGGAGGHAGRGRSFGLIRGGLIGSLLLGRPWKGGISLLDVMLLSGFIYWVFWSLSTLASARAATAQQVTPAPSQAVAVAEPAKTEDTRSDYRRYADMAAHAFLKVQAAWATRNMAGTGDLLSPELGQTLRRDCERMRADRVINHLKDVKIAAAEVTTVRQDVRRDSVTVYLAGSLVDYTTDERGTVLEGDPVAPVRFAEFWTFVRSVGDHRWRLFEIREPV